MPGFDGTGPMGMGPRTGGGRGYCPPVAGAQASPAWTGPFLRGAGRGGVPWGGGRGRVHGGGRRCWPGFPYYGSFVQNAAVLDAQQEIAFLRNQASVLEQELAAVRKRIEEMAAKDET